MKKYRQTKQKETIRNICLNSSNALSINDIHDMARKAIPSLNLATVYRNINKLVNEGQLIKFSHPTKGTFYEKAGKPHHHHFFCSDCNTAIEIPGCGLSLEKPINDGFIIDSHEVFLHGTCAKCAS